MDSNHRSPARKSRFLFAEGELRDRTGAAKKGLFLMRYRWFESISLQRRVRNEPDLPRSVRRGSETAFRGGCDARGAVHIFPSKIPTTRNQSILRAPGDGVTMHAVTPAMQQAKQPFCTRLQLLAWLALNAGKHTGNQPTRLAHQCRPVWRSSARMMIWGILECQMQDTCFRRPSGVSGWPVALPVPAWRTN
jgi:hypothetical protein